MYNQINRHMPILIKMILLIIIKIEEMDQLPSDILLCIIAYVDSKTLLSICSVSYRFVELNLESLLRQKLTHLSRLNLKNHNLKRLINLIKFPFKSDRISACNYYSMILANSQIYVFDTNALINTPTLINNIIDMSAGEMHSIILNNECQIYYLVD